MNGKQIHEFLDGRLDAAAERRLFAEMSENEELRQEFIAQQRLHGIIKKDMAAAVTPPDLTNSVFANLGFAPPGIAPPPAPSFAGKILSWFGGATGYIITGVAAAVTVFLLMSQYGEYAGKLPLHLLSTRRIESRESPLDKSGLVRSSRDERTIPPTLPSLPALSQQERVIRAQPAIRKGIFSSSSGERGRAMAFGAVTAMNPAISLENGGNDGLNPAESAAQGEAPRSCPESITAVAPQPYPMRPFVPEMPMSPEAGQRYPAAQQQESRWMFQARTVQHISSNFNDVRLIFKPYLSVGALYSFNPYHALGGEAGYESFRIKSEDGDNAAQWQDVWWGGVSYKAAFPQLSPTEYITPEIRLSLGMTTTGSTPTPGVIFRSTGGLTFSPGNGTHYTLGAESAWLMLPGDVPTTAQRFGLVLGAALEL